MIARRSFSFVKCLAIQVLTHETGLEDFGQRRVEMDAKEIMVGI